MRVESKWQQLTEEERQKILSMMEDPTILTQLTLAAQLGDLVAAEALLAKGDMVVVQNTDKPEETFVIK